MSNFPTIAELVAMKEDELQSVSVETLAICEEMLAASKAGLAQNIAAFEAIKLARFGTLIEPAYKAAQKDTGKVSLVVEDQYQVSVTRKKDVRWDEEYLKQKYGAILDAGDDPAIYIKREFVTTYTIPEAVYQGWSEEYQAAFRPGRTVKPAKPVITITKAKEYTA